MWLLFREKALTAAGRQQAMARLDYLRRRWHEVQPGDDVRDEAERLLTRHPLRAGDALQLSAALIWCPLKCFSRIRPGPRLATVAAPGSEPAATTIV